ncbi:hypothetical protein Aperf_G00000067046 [Anoplocephala perfoliata]
MANDEDLSSDSMSDDLDDLGSLIMSESRYPVRLSDEEFEKVKAKIISDLRIGGPHRIGERHPFMSAVEATKSREMQYGCEKHEKYTRIGQSPCISALNLLFARQYGMFRPSASYNGLCDICSKSSVSTHACDVYTRWPPFQGFKWHLLGNPWTVTSFGLTGVYEHHRGCVNAITFNSSGHLIASGSDDRYVAIMDTYTGDLKTRFRSGHSLNVFQVKFVQNSGDLKLVTSARDGGVRLAELRPDGQLTRSPFLLANHKEACHNIVFIPTEPSILLTAGEDGIVNSIDLRTKEPQQILNLPLMPFYSIDTSLVRPYEFCVGGKYDAHVKVFDRRKVSVSSPKDGYLFAFCPRRLMGASDCSNRDTTERDSNQTAHDSDDDDVDVDMPDDDDSDDEDFDTGVRSFIQTRLSRQILHFLNMHSTSHTRPPSAPPESGSDGMGRRSPARFDSGIDPLGDFSLAKFCVTSAVYSSNGDAILASLNDEDIYLFDSQDDQIPPLHVYRGHRNSDTVKRVSFYGPNSEYIVSGSDDGFIYIWDRHSEGIVQWLCGDLTFAVSAIEPHPHYPMMATCGCDNSVKLWSPVGRCHDLDRPGSWLKTVKSKDPGRPPSFDPQRMVQSMLLLRKSELSKRIFGEDEDFRITSDDQEECDDESVDNERGEEREAIYASGSVNDNNQGSTVARGCGSDAAANRSRKRKSPEKEEASSSSPKSFKHEDDPVSPAESPRPSNKLPLTIADQRHLPFNYKDLILRVAMNWGKRLRDSSSLMFTVDLPDIFRPMLQPEYPHDSDTEAYRRFLRDVSGGDRSQSSSDEEDVNGDSDATFASPSSPSSSGSAASPSSEPPSHP